MIPAFNLLDEPWLPVRFIDGTVRDVGLLELFDQAGQIGSLAETSPPNLIACYRLLLAIIHRVLTHAQGTWKDRDRVRWYHEGLPENAMREYLEHWREGFWLFHPECPFMQVAALATAEETRDKLKPWTQISLASASGNNPVLFDHSVDSHSYPIEAFEAFRLMLGYLQFAPGGMVKAIKFRDEPAALVNAAAVIPLGATLHQTLCLGLHPSPTPSNIDDLPTWEKRTIDITDIRKNKSLTTGVNDLYTRLTRAVLLVQENNQDQIRFVHFSAGLALELDDNAPDPMVSYRVGRKGLVKLSFSGGKAIWRDLPALLASTNENGQQAAILSYAANLKLALESDGGYQPLVIAGVSSKIQEYKVFLWRSEYIALPATFLTNPDRANILSQEVRRAEDVFRDLKRLATQMYAATMPDPDHKDTRDRARETASRGPAAAIFFSELEQNLPKIMALLAQDAADEAYAKWSQCLHKAVKNTWDALSRNLGQSPVALHAEARAYFGYKEGKKRIPGVCALLSQLKHEAEITKTVPTSEEA